MIQVIDMGLRSKNRQGTWMFEHTMLRSYWTPQSDKGWYVYIYIYPLVI